MEKAGKIFIVLLVSAWTAACGSGRGSAAETDAVDRADTTAAEPPRALPDTAYASASRVKIEIDMHMAGTDSVVDSFDDPYRTAPGHMTFRGNQLRDADFGGTVTGRPDSLAVEWTFTTHTDFRDTGAGRWGGGSGWTGQPLFVEWPDSLVRQFRSAGTVTPDFGPREIMVGSLASRVYFINFDTGKASRPAIHVDNPVKGTISLDPRLNGSIYAGLGVPAQQPVGTRVIDLNRGRVTQVIGNDPKARRRWFAADASALRVGQFVFHPSENGTLYKYVADAPGSLKLHSAMRYTVNGASPGMEASMSAFRNYGYVADNHGNVICLNLNSLRPVWHASLGDDIDATPVVCVEGDQHPYIYVGCEVDRSGRGYSEFMKLDGLNGDTVWHHRIDGQRFTLNEKHFDGGYYATALPGRGNCENLIFVNVVKNLNERQNGSFVAFRRDNGEIAYETPLAVYAWSSPVGFMNENNEMFVVTGDCNGRLYLIDGATGHIIRRLQAGSNFESSPVVRGNSLVVGSRGDKIFKIKVI